MTETVPDPLVPAEVDLRDFAFMPLDVRRLRDSRLVAVRTAEEALAAILLWSASWHQQPASSLPNDDLELSVLSGYGGARGLKEFRRIREGALHGFILCCDGRWYHPVVAEKAAEAWNGRLELEWRRAADRVRKDNKDRKERSEQEHMVPAKPALLSVQVVGGIPTYRAWQSVGIQAESNSGYGGILASVRAGSRAGAPPFERDRGKGQGKGIGESGKVEVKPEPKVKPASAAPKNGASDPGRTVPLWNAYSEAYRRRYSVDPTRNAKVNGMLAKFLERLPADEAPAVAAFYLTHNRGLYVSAKHPVDLLLRDAEGLRTEWATNRKVTDTEARQADQTQARGDVFSRLIAESEASP